MVGRAIGLLGRGDGVRPLHALGFAERACTAEEAAGGGQLWSYLDTLALARHATGDVAAAVETQRRAISLMPDGAGDPGIAERLAEYEAALAAIGEDADTR